MLLDLTLDVVSALLDSNSVRRHNSIGFISKFARSAYSMHQCAPQRVVELVLLGRVRDFTAV